MYKYVEQLGRNLFINYHQRVFIQKRSQKIENNWKAEKA